MKTVAIIGGGITGLTAAFRLQEKGVRVTLYEGGSRVGGVIQSVRRDGFLAECGPNTVLETSPKISALVHDLGLNSRRLYSAPTAEKRYLVRNGRPVELPGSLPAFIGTSLFKTAAKFRLLTEPFIARADAEAEESVQEFVLRRLGRDFLDYAINPLVGGVYAGDPARLSVTHAFPKLRAVEQKYGSLILGQVLGARERRRSGEVSKQSARKVSFDEGLQVFTDTLAAKLGNSVRLGSMVECARQTAEGWQVFARTGDNEEFGIFDAVLFAGTAHALGKLRISTDHSPDLTPMTEVYYPPVASVVLGFKREQVAHPLDGFGMLIPEVEKFNTLGTLFSSSLFPNRAPSGRVLLTSYIGGARNPDSATRQRDTLVELAMQDLRRLLGVAGEPVFAHHFVYPKAIPQYEVGYGRFKELMNRVESGCPGFFLAGHFRDGISLGDSIVSGHTAAERIQTFLGRDGADRPAPEMQMKAAA